MLVSKNLMDIRFTEYICQHDQGILQRGDDTDIDVAERAFQAGYLAAIEDAKISPCPKPECQELYDELVDRRQQVRDLQKLATKAVSEDLASIRTLTSNNLKLNLSPVLPEELEGLPIDLLPCPQCKSLCCDYESRDAIARNLFVECLMTDCRYSGQVAYDQDVTKCHELAAKLWNEDELRNKSQLEIDEMRLKADFHISPYNDFCHYFNDHIQHWRVELGQDRYIALFDHLANKGHIW
jgi:hypothetical protein